MTEQKRCISDFNAIDSCALAVLICIVRGFSYSDHLTAAVLCLRFCFDCVFDCVVKTEQKTNISLVGDACRRQMTLNENILAGYNNNKTFNPFNLIPPVHTSLFIAI